MNINVTVPNEGEVVDLVVEQCRSIFNRISGARAEWIEGTLELATFMLKTRRDWPDHRSFSQWLERHGLQKVTKDERTALMWMAENQEAARGLLERTKSMSWDVIYRTRPNRTLRNFPKGPLSHNSGSSKRKRAAVIPECMRDDYVPGSIKARADTRPAESKRSRRGSGRVATSLPVAERAVVRLKVLKPTEVDPDFKGTPLEFTAKYGHVLLQTKQQIEYQKQQEQLMAWLGPVSDHAKTARLLLAAIAADPATLREWMAKPSKAEKLQAWCASMEQACESVRKIITTAKPGAIAPALGE